MTALLKHHEAETRTVAASVVEHFAINESAIELAVLLRDPDTAVRHAALVASTKVRPIDWPAIHERLQDPEPDVVKAAIHALNDSGRLTVDDAASLMSSQHSTIRQTAAYALSRISSQEARDLLLSYIYDPAQSVRIQVIQSLHKLKSKEAIPTLILLLKSEQDTIILSNVINMLTDVGQREAVPFLIDATRHSIPMIRFEVAWAVGEIGDRRAIPALRPLLDDQVVPCERGANGSVSTTSFPICEQARRALHKLGVRVS